MKMKFAWWLSFLAFLAASPRLPAADRLPNIIIIFTDDQGYGDVGCFGAKGFETPNLDRLARQGRRFTNFHVAQPVCSASRAALLTGNYPNRIGIHGALGPNAEHGIADGETTLAELLKQKGYATGMAGKWHLGHHRRFLPLHHGFDEYLGLPYSNDMWPYHPEAKLGTYPSLPLIEGDQIIDPNVTSDDQRHLTGMYTERAVSFIERHKDRPFFFYLAHSMPHVPLYAGEGYRGKSAQGLYGDVIQEIDASVGKVVDALEANGVAQNTLVLFATDNGPWLSYGDHAGSAGPLREGKGTCWEGGVRVPCIMRWPGHIPANSTSDAMLMTIDLLPTIARLAGAHLPDHPIDGLDVWPLLAGEAGATNPHDAYVYYYEQNQLQAVVSGDGRWKLQLPHTYRTLAGQLGGHDGNPVKYEQKKIVDPELYDLVSDLGETTDVAARHPDIVNRLLAVAERARNDLGDSLTKRAGRGIRAAGKLVATAIDSTDISPAKWTAADRERAEKQEAAGWAPSATRSISGKKGMISAIASPIAVQAGIEALKCGGTAADAAATVALTEITTQLGSVVSYAGIMTLVYYDARTGKVHSLDAGYNSYRNETEPSTIPAADLGPLNSAFQPLRDKQASGSTTAAASTKGRETLVPGFMTGIEAMHARFGRLPFAELFEPAIWYADRGVIVNAPLAQFFNLRRDFLARTPEGRQFLHQAGNELPQSGDRFRQPELAKTLRAVAKHGSRYMYTGAWGQEFVKTIRREGGKVVIDDLAGYQVDWSDALSTTFAAHRVDTAGLPSQSAYHILPALNLAEALKLDQKPPYWKSAGALRDLRRIGDLTENAPDFDPRAAAFLHAKGVDISPAAQLGKAYANAVAPLLEKLEAESRAVVPRHSDAVVAIDSEGSIAAVTHTINSVIWGDTGIVVGGIPIPDSAGFQQARLATIKPGDRLPNEMMQTIVFTGDKPVLATAAIGSSMIPETIKVVLAIAGQRVDMQTVQAAPPLLSNLMLGMPGQSATDRGLVIPDGAYSAELLKDLEAQGVKLVKIPAATASGLRGTVVAVEIDPKTGERHTVETPGVLVFGGAE